MVIDPKITEVVDRIADAWNYQMSTGMRLEYEEALNGLDARALDKAVTELRDTIDQRPSVNKIKLAYDKYRPVTKQLALAQRQSNHPYDIARRIVTRERAAIIARSKPLFDQIQSEIGKGKLRDYLMAAAWVMAQGVTSNGSEKAPMAFAKEATGYMTWTDPGNDLREARALFQRGRDLGRIEIEVPARAMDWFRSWSDEPESKGLKRVPVESFEKEQRFYGAA